MNISDRFNGSTSVYGIIGNPIEHSFSPVLQNTLIEKYGINGVYSPFRVDEDKVGDALKGLFALGIKGINVTVPHKKAVMPYLERIDETADIIGAVNTLKKTDTGFEGYNTDILGLKKSFELNGVEIKDKKVMLLGAGGAANAAAVLLCQLGAKEIILVNRTKQKAEELKDHILKYFNADVSIISYDEMESIEKPDVIINTTSVGMGEGNYASPVKNENYFEGVKAVFDAIYIPWETKLLSDAKRCGCKTINGFDMLIYQGIASFEIWNGISVSDEDAVEIRNILGEYFLRRK